MHAFLVAVEVVAGSVWIGGLVAIAVVGQIVRVQLAPPARVEFFRTLGRRYLAVGGVSLAAALACGGALLTRGGWTDTRSAAVAVAAALVLVTVAGVLQARALTRARHRGLATFTGELVAAQLRRRARAAGALRGLIALLTLVLVVLAAVIAG